LAGSGGPLAGVIGGLAGMAVGVVGNLIVNALIPPNAPSSRRHTLKDLSGIGRGSTGAESPTLFIEGAKNQANKFGPIPRPLGYHRMTPPYGAEPYTEVVGNDQFLRCLFVWGYGPLDISDIKIGETAIGEFDDVEIETVEGYATDPPLTLYTNDIHEEALSVLLTYNAMEVRTTNPDANEISVDLTFPNGLTSVDPYSGNRGTREVTVRIEKSATGASVWSNVTNLVVSAATGSAVRKGHRFTVATGQYDIRLTRLTQSGGNYDYDLTYWTALRTIKTTSAINFGKPLAMTALRIKATNQLHGTVDELNGIVKSIVPDWDPGTSTWIATITRNPASLFRTVLRDAANARAITLTRVDLDTLQSWHVKCTTASRTYSKIIDYNATVREVLEEIAAAGRASLFLKDNKWSVILDETQTTPIQHFTPRNSWQFEGQKTFPDLPHGWRVRFINELKDYQQDERIVYDDGYSEASATKFETLELPGVTHPNQVWKEGRYHIAVARLRPETYSFYADVEHIVCTRGDLIKVSHDVPLWGLDWGRVKSTTSNTIGIIGVNVDESLSMVNDGTRYNLRFRLQNGNSIVREIDVHTSIPGVTVFGTGAKYGTGCLYNGPCPGETFETTYVALLTALPPGGGIINIGDLFMFGELDTESADLLVTVVEPEGRDLTAKITCVDYNTAIYAADTGEIPEFTSNITIPTEWYTPTTVSTRSDGTVLIRDADGSWLSRILVTYKRITAMSEKVIGIECQYWRTDSTVADPITLPVVSFNAGEVSIVPVEDGISYDFRLRFVKKDGSRGPWTDIETHVVVGKTAPPNDVTSFFAYQSEAVINLSWSQVPDLDLAGYEIRYGTTAIDWADAIPLSQVLKGTTITSALIPPGTWDIMIKAIDTSGNYSTNENRKSLVITNSYLIISSAESSPAWLGTLTNFVRNPFTGNLNIDSPSLATGNNFNVFNSYIYNPCTISTFIAPEIDISFDDDVRVWGYINSNLGPGETGLANPSMGLDYRTESGSYDGYETSWGVGLVTGRYFKTEVVNRSTIGVARIAGFRSVIDAKQKEESKTVSIATGGTLVVFDSPFHNTPNVQGTALASGGQLRIAYIGSVTTTGFIGKVYTSNGTTSVHGTLIYTATSREV
jgi:hypothetical protein